MAEEQFQKRQIAYKIAIKDILNSKYIKQEGFNPNYLDVESREVSRCNIIAAIVEKNGDSFNTLVLDDGTGKINARSFENNVFFEGVNIGDIVQVIGRPREFSSEKYLLVEIIKKMSPEWARVRKKELREGPTTAEVEGVEENQTGLSQKDILLKIIKESDKGEGVSIENISSEEIKDIDSVVDILLREGDVFEVKPGKLKVLE